MASLTLPTAANIWAKFSSKMAPNSFINTPTGAHVEDKIDLEILPDVAAELGEDADKAAYPHDFPFDVDFILARNSTWTKARAEEQIAKFQGFLNKAVFDYTGWKLHEDIASIDAAYMQLALYYKANYKESRKAFIDAIHTMALRTPETQAEDASSGYRSHSVRVRPRFGW